jgi:hypothetical protein
VVYYQCGDKETTRGPEGETMTTYRPSNDQLAAVARCRVDRPRRFYVARPRPDDAFATVEVWENYGPNWDCVAMFQGRDATRLDGQARRWAARLARENDRD